ncbi:MAG: hypothetical protein ACK2UQ_17045, partial [Anaerolineae bacterium]
MSKKHSRLVITIASLFLIQIACQTITGPRPTQPSSGSPAPASPTPGTLSTATSPGTEPPAARPTTDDAPRVIPSGETGLACFGSFGYGITCIENNEWVNYNKQNGTL